MVKNVAMAKSSGQSQARWTPVNGLIKRRYGQFEIKQVSAYHINAQRAKDGRSATATATRSLTRSSVPHGAGSECWTVLNVAASLTSVSLAAFRRRWPGAT
jgi:hypothetical protein